MKIMFICTGNICRSAMAHVMLEERAKQENKDIQVFSCGVFADNGDRPTEEAISVLSTIYDVDLSKHRATNISNSSIEEMDVILCATTSHKNNVLNRYPELNEKVFTMKEYAGYPENDLDINDPWGCSYETYKRCAEEISDVIEKIVFNIKSGH